MQLCSSCSFSFREHKSKGYGCLDSFTLSVKTNILTSVPTKKEKLPLSVTHPELAKEADGWDPTTVMYSSKESLPWKCRYGHAWSSKPISRSGNGRNVKTSPCPVCSGQLPEKGKTDLSSLHPEISGEADGWDPSEYFPGSNRKMTWKCKQGHRWQAVIYERAKRNSRCPYCSNTKVMPGFNDLQTLFPQIASEAVDWDPARVNPGSHKKYIWRCPKGHTWSSTPMHRTRMRQGCGVCDNKQIQEGVNDLKSQYPRIAELADGWNPSTVTSGSRKRMPWVCQYGHKWSATVGDVTSRSQSCPFCSNTRLLTGFNDLKTKFPLIASEAFGWEPSLVHPGTNSRKNWICKYDHKWRATVNSRTVLGAKCPFCSGSRVLQGFNDLMTTNPEFADQAFGWDPTKYSAGSGIRKKWRCPEGHIWTTAINVRKKSGCPTCAFSGFDPNKPSYLYFLKQNEWAMFQIGITNDLSRRLSEHEKNRWEVVEVRGPIDGQLAKEWEAAILRMLKAKGADLSNEKVAGRFDGYSEAWSKSSFEVKSIKVLMQLTEEFENGR